MMRRSETVGMWVAQSDLTVTFGAELTNPSRMTKIGLALFGKLGMRMPRKALAKDLAEISVKAELL